jgi:hypothetical protein
MIKILINFVEEDVILNNFCNCNFLRFSTYFELNQRFRVHRGDVQGLSEHHADMHKQYLTNEEDIEFPKVSSVKQLPGISLKLNT